MTKSLLDKTTNTYCDTCKQNRIHGKDWPRWRLLCLTCRTGYRPGDNHPRAWPDLAQDGTARPPLVPQASDDEGGSPHTPEFGRIRGEFGQNGVGIRGFRCLNRRFRRL